MTEFRREEEPKPVEAHQLGPLIERLIGLILFESGLAGLDGLDRDRHLRRQDHFDLLR